MPARGSASSVAYAAVAAAGLTLFGVFRGSVPVWVLGLVVLLAVVVAAVLTSGHQRREANLQGQLTAKTDRVTQLESELVSVRHQIQEATKGEVPLSKEAASFVRKVRVLMNDMEESMGDVWASDAQEAIYDDLVLEFRRVFNEDSLSGRARAATVVQPGDGLMIQTLRTMLRQLEAYALEAGKLEA